MSFAISNTLDEVLFGAFLGVVPTDDDIAKVTPPPGVDPFAFAGQVAAWAAEVADFRHAGQNRYAEDRAAAIAATYLAAFDAQVTPRLALSPDQSPFANADSMTPAELAAALIAANPNMR